MGRRAPETLIAVLGACLVVPACSPSPPADSAVLLTVDTWRADRFGAGGHPDVRTPHLDRFFRGGLQFADAYSVIPTTLASHATLLSGEWSTGHGVPRNGWPVPPDVDTIAEILGREGFATGAFVSSAALHPELGLDQGFDVYDFEAPHAVARDQDWRGAEETLRRAQSWWGAETGRRFLWVHVFEPHFPYAPAPEDLALYETGYRGDANGSMDYLFSVWERTVRFDEADRAHLEALYHAEITGLDRKLGRFLEAFAREEGVVTVVVADHGESLGEHGLDFKHGPLVYAADIQVPLLFRGAEPFAPGISGALTSTVDVCTTLLGRLGVDAPRPEGTHDLAGPAAARPLAYAEASMPWNVEEEGLYPNVHKQRVVRTPEWSYVETPYLGGREWYRRSADPAELSPVPTPADPEGLPALLDDWIARGRDRPAPTTVDPALVDRLRSLGYIE
ncbi:sulfatase-like hydrolase/transferase [bacterium]|nr:sulfatase-like hydrolase/transferase [bacterium]